MEPALGQARGPQLRQIRRVVPQLASLRVIRVWSGVESYLPDDRPIMGPSGRVPGLYYAFGFCGHGFQLGPGVGDAMAELNALPEAGLLEGLHGALIAAGVDGPTRRLLEVVAVAGAPVSLASAIVSDQWVSSHDQYGRNRP